jgi:alkylation response protein AidB-like acyl-CoA dehydrogenase
MTETQTLAQLAEELGPTIAKDAAERDEAGEFVAENYTLLKEHKVFSAQVPTKLGGRGASHSEICDFIRRLARIERRGTHCGRRLSRQCAQALRQRLARR